MTKHADLAKRLRDARIAAGITQEETAKAINVLRPAIAQIEAGKRRLTSIEFMALSRLYGRPPQSFFNESSEPDGFALVLRAIPEARKDHVIRNGLSRGIEIIHAVLELEKMMGEPSRRYAFPLKRLPRPRRTWDSVVQGRALAEEERNRLKLGTDPIRDPSVAMEKQGFLVLSLALPPAVSGFTLRSGESIICAVNALHPPTRRQYSLAHEYCHALCDMEDESGIVSREAEKKDYREVRADVFAACFMMPEEGVMDFLNVRGKAIPSRISAPLMVREELVEYEARRPGRPRDIDYFDVIQLADAFGVSREAVLWRLRNLELINEEEQDYFRKCEKEGYGHKIARLVQPNDEENPGIGRSPLSRAEQRLFSLANEAANTDLISRTKMIELLRLAGLRDDEIFELPHARRNR